MFGSLSESSDCLAGLPKGRDLRFHRSVGSKTFTESSLQPQPRGQWCRWTTLVQSPSQELFQNPLNKGSRASTWELSGQRQKGPGSCSSISSFLSWRDKTSDFRKDVQPYKNSQESWVSLETGSNVIFPPCTSAVRPRTR